MKKLAWIALQVATFAVVIWSETSSSRRLGTKPDFTTASIVGVVAALFMTALVAAVQDLYMRHLSPRRRNAGAAFDPSTAIAHDSETGRESERLAAPTGSGSDGPKLIGGRRIG